MVTVQPCIDASVHPRFAAFIVGWSRHDNKPELIVYNDAAGLGSGTVSTSNEIVSPRLLEEEQREVMATLRASAMATGRNPAITDIVIATMQAQRRRRANPDFAPDTHFVGGHITETVIDARGVREKVVHRWNDEIGHKVQPDAAPSTNVVVLSGGTSRAERRRQAKQQKGKAA